jgi:hypothetical protein
VSRREVLDRLFAGTGIEIKWVNLSYGDQLISGTFRGEVTAIARQLLARTDFVLVRDRIDEASRITRIVIVGPAKGEQSPARLATIAVQPVGQANHRPKAQLAAAPTGEEVPNRIRPGTHLKQGEILEPPPATDSAPIPLVIPGAITPQAIASTQADIALPVMKSGAGFAVPPLGRAK